MSDDNPNDVCAPGQPIPMTGDSPTPDMGLPSINSPIPQQPIYFGPFAAPATANPVDSANNTATSTTANNTAASPTANNSVPVAIPLAPVNQNSPGNSTAHTANPTADQPGTPLNELDSFFTQPTGPICTWCNQTHGSHETCNFLTWLNIRKAADGDTNGLFLRGKLYRNGFIVDKFSWRVFQDALAWVREEVLSFRKKRWISEVW